MTEDNAQWNRDIRLRECARDLALQVLQSTLYVADIDVRCSVDEVLELTEGK